MSKHTPGPWRYWTQRRNPEDTCTFQNLQGAEVLRAVTVTLTEADARLIAAAPDLLGALEELERQAELSLDYRPEFRRAIGDACAAIFKATGEIK